MIIIAVRKKTLRSDVSFLLAILKSHYEIAPSALN